MTLRNTQGSCPYENCDSVTYEQPGVERRPGQRVLRCVSCQMYSMRSVRTGAQYPLDTPTDPTSSPSINSPK